MAKVLVLSSVDYDYDGLGWHTSKSLITRGHEVCFISMTKRMDYTKNYFYDIRTRVNRLNPLYRFHSKIDSFILSQCKPINKHCFESSYMFGIAAKKILEKCPFKPDYIIFSWFANFLTPKTIRELYDITHARIVFSMVDESILALCHYPCECTQYETGCTSCPGLTKNKYLAEKIYKEKLRFWSNMPADIIGTGFDLDLARRVPFLSHMKMHSICAVPSGIPQFSKDESRFYFDIPRDHFVIFIGANNISDERKGFKYVLDALEYIKVGNKNITILIVGNNCTQCNFCSNLSINIVRRNFLPKEDFFKAYYACDLYVSPSIADSGPMMVNFSIACGRPVVSFPVGVAAELIIDNYTGYIAKMRDSADLANGIIMFYNKTENEMSLISNNCKDLISSFSDLDPWNFII